VAGCRSNPGNWQETQRQDQWQIPQIQPNRQSSPENRYQKDMGRVRLGVWQKGMPSGIRTHPRVTLIGYPILMIAPLSPIIN